MCKKDSTGSPDFQLKSVFLNSYLLVFIIHIIFIIIITTIIIIIYFYFIWREFPPNKAWCYKLYIHLNEYVAEIDELLLKL